MPLFDRPTETSVRSPVAVPELAAYAAQSGWSPLGAEPLRGVIRDIAASAAVPMYGRLQYDEAESTTLSEVVTLTDGWTGRFDEHNFAVAACWIPYLAGLRQQRWLAPVAVCAVTLKLPARLRMEIRPQPFSSSGHDRKIQAEVGDPEFDQRFSVLLSGQVSAQPPKARDLLTPPVRQQIMARDDWIFTALPYAFACARRAAFESAEAVRQQLSAMFTVFGAMPKTAVPTTAEEPGDALVRFLLEAPTLQDARSRLASLSPAERELVEQCQDLVFLLLSGQIESKDMAGLLRRQDRETRLRQASQMQRIRVQRGRTFDQDWLRQPKANPTGR
jgi:hypothetical protein